MAANARKALPWVAATAAVALTAVLLAVFLAAPEPAAPGPGAEASTAAPAALAPAAPSAPPSGASPVPGAGDPASAEAALLHEPAAAPAGGPPELYPVDLERLRAKLPDNIYWELAAPTKDVEVLKKRDADSRRWNDVYGKVLSGTATEAEIHQYYAHRRQVSEDFIAFATTVLAEYGGELPERDQGLYQLSIDMHRTRLAELPGQEADALERRQLQERRREAWRQGQQAP